MLELPEVIYISRQLGEQVTGKKVIRVLPPTKNHKFCWYNGAPEEYAEMIEGAAIEGAEGFGIYVEIRFSNGCKLCFNDGVNVRLIKTEALPKAYQLAIAFEDGEALVFTVAMYGGIILHRGEYDNEYYQKSREALSPFSGEFRAYYDKRMAQSKQTLSAKAFLDTEQRFPGIGNGVLQDILLEAGIHPKRKINTLEDTDREKLFSCTLSVLQEMIDQGGRDTEKDIFGNPGGYKTRLSKNTYKSGCPHCGGEIVKASYLGGSVYFCPKCQPLMII